MTVKLAGKISLATFKTASLICCLTCCMLVAACGGAHTQPVSEPESAGPAHGASSAKIAGHELPATGEAVTGRSGRGDFSPVRPGLQLQQERSGSEIMPEAHTSAMAPVWQPLAAQLAADGLSGPRVDALLATLAPTPSQSPMGRKMLELYKSRFMPRPPPFRPPGGPARRCARARDVEGARCAAVSAICSSTLTVPFAPRLFRPVKTNEPHLSAHR